MISEPRLRDLIEWGDQTRAIPPQIDRRLREHLRSAWEEAESANPQPTMDLVDAPTEVPLEPAAPRSVRRPRGRGMLLAAAAVLVLLATGIGLFQYLGRDESSTEVDVVDELPTGNPLVLTEGTSSFFEVEGIAATGDRWALRVDAVGPDRALVGYGWEGDAGEPAVVSADDEAVRVPLEILLGPAMPEECATVTGIEVPAPSVPESATSYEFSCAPAPGTWTFAAQVRWLDAEEIETSAGTFTALPFEVELRADTDPGDLDRLPDVVRVWIDPNVGMVAQEISDDARGTTRVELSEQETGGTR